MQNLMLDRELDRYQNPKQESDTRIRYQNLMPNNLAHTRRIIALTEIGIDPSIAMNPESVSLLPRYVPESDADTY
jgi:hypothetical protein